MFQTFCKVSGFIMDAITSKTLAIWHRFMSMFHQSFFSNFD